MCVAGRRRRMQPYLLRGRSVHHGWLGSEGRCEDHSGVEGKNTRAWNKRNDGPSFSPFDTILNWTVPVFSSRDRGPNAYPQTMSRYIILARIHTLVRSRFEHHRNVLTRICGMEDSPGTMPGMRSLPYITLLDQGTLHENVVVVMTSLSVHLHHTDGNLSPYELRVWKPVLRSPRLPCKY